MRMPDFVRKSQPSQNFIKNGNWAAAADSQMAETIFADELMIFLIVYSLTENGKNVLFGMNN